LLVRYLKLEVKEIACLHNEEPSSDVSKYFALSVSKLLSGIKKQCQKIQINTKEENWDKRCTVNKRNWIYWI